MKTKSLIGVLFVMILSMYFSMTIAQDVKLQIPLKDIYEPEFIYSPASNGGTLITEPGGTIRYFYRLEQGIGAMLYEDISYDGEITWKIKKEVLNTGEGSRSDIRE